MAIVPPYRFFFGPFELNHRRADLRRNNVPVDLQPQPFRALMLLVERAGYLVTRDELRRHLWGDAFVEYDQGLNFCIRRVRAALCDDAVRPRYIETVPRRGYRFIAPVRYRPQVRPAFRVAILGVLAAAAIGVVVRPRPVPAELRQTEAHALIAQGRYLLDKRTASAVARSVTLFRQALQLDSLNAPAHVGLADAYYATAARDRSAIVPARTAAERALALRPQLAAAHMRLGDIALFYDRDFVGARSAYERAVTHEPTFARGWHALATWHSLYGHHDSAVSAIHRAAALDPVTPLIKGDIGWTYYFAGRYAEAENACRATLELEPDDDGAWGCVLDAARLQGAYDRALEAARRLMRIRGADAVALESLERNGLVAFFQWDLDQLERRVESDHVSPAWLAMAHARLGNTAGVLHWGRRSRDEQERLFLFLVSEPTVRSLEAGALINRLIAGRP